MKKHYPNKERLLESVIRTQVVLYWVMCGISFIFTLIFLFTGFSMGSDFFEEPFEVFFNNDNYLNDFEVIHFVFFIFYLANTILRLLNAIQLSKKKNQGFSLFVGAYTILSFPLGTALGIYSLVRLSKQDVKDLYYKAAEQREVIAYRNLKI